MQVIKERTVTHHFDKHSLQFHFMSKIMLRCVLFSLTSDPRNESVMQDMLKHKIWHSGMYVSSINKTLLFLIVKYIFFKIMFKIPFKDIQNATPTIIFQEPKCTVFFLIMAWASGLETVLCRRCPVQSIYMTIKRNRGPFVTSWIILDFKENHKKTVDTIKLKCFWFIHMYFQYEILNLILFTYFNMCAWLFAFSPLP